MNNKYLTPTSIINSDHKTIIDYAMVTIDGSKDPIERAVKLYYKVRDGIWYTPYYPFYLPEHYRASNVLKSGKGYCVCKASLLCALGRACKIPSRIGFADVRNHLATKQLIEFLGSDLFVYHGFVEFYLDGELRFTDYQEPFTWSVDASRGLHTVEVFGYNEGNKSKAVRDVFVLR